MIVKIFQDTANFLAAVNWPLVLNLLGSGAVITVIAQFVKQHKWLKDASDWVIRIVVFVLSLAAIILQAIVTNPAMLNSFVQYGSTIFAFATLLYPIVRLIQQKINDYKAAENAHPATTASTAAQNADLKPTVSPKYFS